MERSFQHLIFLSVLFLSKPFFFFLYKEKTTYPGKEVYL